MTSMKHLSEDTIMSILDYLNYHDLFHKEKSIISKLFYHNTQKILKKSKSTNIVSSLFLSLYWEKKELERVPIVLFCPNLFGMSLKTRLFNIFDEREPHQMLFISNIFTNSLSFMIRQRQEDNRILFVEFSENKLNYNVYTRHATTNQILY